MQTLLFVFVHMNTDWNCIKSSLRAPTESSRTVYTALVKFPNCKYKYNKTNAACRPSIHFRSSTSLRCCGSKKHRQTDLTLELLLSYSAKKRSILIFEQRLTCGARLLIVLDVASVCLWNKLCFVVGHRHLSLCSRSRTTHRHQNTFSLPPTTSTWMNHNKPSGLCDFVFVLTTPRRWSLLGSFPPKPPHAFSNRPQKRLVGWNIASSSEV